ncbi:MAG: TolC family protein [Candidatus Hydrogenedentes bacterium]|nr:TolC family protein [Candidatus Hydrogenedentota bacterium]
MAIVAVVVSLIPAYGRDAAASPESAEHIGDAVSPINLANAIVLTLKNSPQLAAFSWEVRAAEARQVQARLRPNPELTVEAEDVRFGRGPGTHTTLRTLNWSANGLSAQTGRESESGARSGFSEAQFTVSLSQVIELGGKRAKRMILAARDRDVTAWDYEVARADVLKGVSQAFVEVLVGQQRVTLDDELVQLAEQVVQTVSARVSAGRVSPLEATKAETALAVARVQANRSRRELESVRAKLAVFWGSKERRFERVDGDLDTARGIPAWDELVQRSSKNPDLARWRAELEKRQTAVSAQKAAAIPDLTVSAGFRMTGMPQSDVRGSGVGLDGFSYSRGNNRSDANWDNSVVVGFSIPLPVFNRNQGSIQEAEHLLTKASEERRATDVQVHATLVESYQSLSSAFTTITALKESILPAATQTFASINEAYRQGRFGYLDVLDAQRTLFDARQQYLDALASYHKTVAEIERTIGGSVWDAEDTPKPRPEEKK